MKSVTDDRHVGMRALLVLLSLGLVATAGLEALRMMEAYVPAGKPSWWWAYGPAVGAVWGLVAAGIGGLASRITAGIYGVAAVVGGAFVLSERPWMDWFQSRWDILGAAFIGGVIAMGVVAVVLAIKPVRPVNASVERSP